MNHEVPSNKMIPTIDIRRRLYQAIVLNLGLWGSESWALKEEDRSKLETFHQNCLRRMCNWTVWDIKIRNGSRTKRLEELLSTHPQWNQRWLSKLSVTEKSKSPRRMLGAWCSTPRPTGRPQQTIRYAYIITLNKLGFEQEEGQLREWMTVARDTGRPTWGTNVESRLGLFTGSFTNLRRPQAVKQNGY
jgi:hypothetical protein